MSSLEGKMINLKSGVSWEEQTLAADVPTRAAQVGQLSAAALAASVRVM